MNKKSIEQEAEELKWYDEFHYAILHAVSYDQAAKDCVEIADRYAATKYSEQQRQVIADTWDAGQKFGMDLMASTEWGENPKAMRKEEFLNNLFPSEIKGEQQT